MCIHNSLPHRDKISMSSLPLSVHVGEQAIARKSRKTFTSVSSLKDELLCSGTQEVVRNNWAGNHSESSSGSSPIKKRSSLMILCSNEKWYRFSFLFSIKRKPGICVLYTCSPFKAIVINFGLRVSRAI